MNERSEIRVTGPDDKGGDVVALQGQFDRIDGQLDVSGVLANGTHPLRDLDQFHVIAREHAPVLVEHPPVGIRLSRDHPAALGECIGNWFEVEGRPIQGVTGTDRQVLVVEI